MTVESSMYTLCTSECPKINTRFSVTCSSCIKTRDLVERTFLFYHLQNKLGPSQHFRYTYTYSSTAVFNAIQHSHHNISDHHPRLYTNIRHGLTSNTINNGTPTSASTYLHLPPLSVSSLWLSKRARSPTFAINHIVISISLITLSPVAIFIWGT